MFNQFSGLRRPFLDPSRNLDLLSLVHAFFLTKCVHCGRYTTVVNPGKNAVAYLVDLGVFNAKPLSNSTEPGQVARTRARSFLLCVHGVIGSWLLRCKIMLSKQLVLERGMMFDAAEVLRISRAIMWRVVARGMWSLS